jgi:hypothetical protein
LAALNPGWRAILASEVQALAAEEGISSTTLRRAREEIVETYQKDGSHWWKLR